MDDCTLEVCVCVCVVVPALVFGISGRLIATIGLQTTSCHSGHEGHKSVRGERADWVI